MCLEQTILPIVGCKRGWTEGLDESWSVRLSKRFRRDVELETLPWQLHGGSNRTEPVRTEPVRMEPVRIKADCGKKGLDKRGSWIMGGSPLQEVQRFDVEPVEAQGPYAVVAFALVKFVY